MNESMILASIDNIDACVQESAISILDKLVLEYDKMSQILDAALFDEGVIMEGQVWDTATGKDKNESVFFKALAFLPRLLMGIIKAVASVFTKDYKSENEKNAKLANAQLAKVNDPNKLEMCRNNVATISDGELEFNPKKKQFFLTRGFRHIRNYIRILIGVTPILTKLRLGLNGAKMPYSTLAKDLFAVLKGEKSLDETTSGLTADALLELANDSWSAATGVKGIVDELQMKLSKKMNEDFANGKNVEDQIHAKAILDGITNVAGKVTKVAMFGKIVHFLGKDLGGGSIFMRKIKSKMAFDKEEDVALANAKNEKKALKSQLKAEKRARANAKEEMRRKGKKRNEVLELDRENEKLRGKLDKQTQLTDNTKATRDEMNSHTQADWGQEAIDRNLNNMYKDSAETEVPDGEEVLDEGLFDPAEKWDPDDDPTEKFENSKLVKGMGKVMNHIDEKMNKDLPEFAEKAHKKFNSSILSRPIGDKDAIEYWEKHHNDPDFDAFNSYANSKLNN